MKMEAEVTERLEDGGGATSQDHGRLQKPEKVRKQIHSQNLQKEHNLGDTLILRLDPPKP